MPIAAMYAHNLPITLFIAYHPWPFRHALTVLSTIAAAGGFWCRQRRDWAIMGYGASHN